MREGLNLKAEIPITSPTRSYLVKKGAITCCTAVPLHFDHFKDSAWSHISKKKKKLLIKSKAVCILIVIIRQKGQTKLLTPPPCSLPQRSGLPGWQNPENVKQCGYPLGRQTHTLPEALHFPFLPYIDHCVARPRMNAAHSWIDFTKRIDCSCRPQ